MRNAKPHLSSRWNSSDTEMRVSLIFGLIYGVGLLIFLGGACTRVELSVTRNIGYKCCICICGNRNICGLGYKTGSGMSCSISRLRTTTGAATSRASSMKVSRGSHSEWVPTSHIFHYDIIHAKNRFESYFAARLTLMMRLTTMITFSFFDSLSARAAILHRYFAMKLEAPIPRKRPPGRKAECLPENMLACIYGRSQV